MDITSTELLGSSFIANMTKTLSSYLDKIEYQSAKDIDLVAERVTECFEGVEWLNNDQFHEKINQLSKIQDLTPQCQNSLKERLEQTEEIYKEAASYIDNRPSEKQEATFDRKSKLLQQLIIEKIQRTIHSLMQLSYTEKNNYVESFKSQMNSIKKERIDFQSKYKLNNPYDKKSSTISSHQMLLLYALDQEVRAYNLESKRDLSLDLYEDTSLLMNIIEKDETIFFRYIDILKLNIDFLSKALNLKPQWLFSVKYNFPELIANREIAFLYLKHYEHNYEIIPPAFLNDPEFVLSILRNRPTSTILMHVSENIRSNLQVAIEAINLNIENFWYIDNSLHFNEELALNAIRKDPRLYKHLTNLSLSYSSVDVEAIALLDDNIKLMNPTDITPFFLEDVMGEKIFRSLDKQQTKGTVDLTAVLEKVWADSPGINHYFEAYDEHRSELIRISIKWGLNRFFKKYDGLEIKDLALEAIEKRGVEFKELGPVLRNDESFALAVLRSSRDTSIYDHMGQDLKSSIKVALEVIKIDCNRLRYLDESVKTCKEVVQAAVNLSITHRLSESSKYFQDSHLPLSSLRPNLYGFTPNMANYQSVLDEGYRQAIRNFFGKPNAKDFRKLALKIVKENGKWLGEIGKTFNDDPEIVQEAIKSKAAVLSMAGPKCRGDKNIAIKAVKYNGFNLEYVSPALKSDRGLVAAAVRQNFSALRFASAKIRGDLTFFPLTRLYHFFKYKFLNFSRLFS